MNYKIIHSEEALKNFIDWLPDLQKHEKYIVCLFTRKKYCEDMINGTDKSQLSKLVVSKDNMFDKIKQLECPLGSYKRKGIPVPQESMVLYVSPNPRNLKEATFKTMEKALKMIKEGDNSTFNIHGEVLSCIQNSKSKSKFCDFDIDDKNVDLTLLNNILPKDAYTVVETRGGYHVLVTIEKAPKTKWHQQIRELYDIDRVGDQLLPIPGCIQGGFVPKFKKI